MDIVKSKNDKLLYRSIELPSQMRCVLVSDPETESSAAAMSVRLNTAEYSSLHMGLVKLIEETLFLGSKHCPDGGDYSRFVTQSNGFLGSFTDKDSNCYYLNIPNAQFKTALEMFSGFLLSPLLQSQSVEKALEKMAALQLHCKLFPYGPKMQLLKVLADPSSPYFNSSRLAALRAVPKEDLPRQLVDLYRTGYCGDQMSLVLYSNRSLDELEKIARKTFADVAARTTEKPTPSPAVFFGTEQMGRLVRYKTIAKNKSLELFFLFPSLRNDFKRKTLGVLAQLLNAQSEGSIFAQLSAEKLAHDLRAGEEHIASAHSFLSLYIGLTPKGFEQAERVLLIVGQYLHNLGREVPRQTIDEFKLLRRTEFDFENKGPNTMRLLGVCRAMGKVPLEHVLDHRFYFEECNPAVYAHALDALRLGNALVLLGSDELEGLPLREEVYETEYSVEPIRPELLTRFANPELDVRQQLHAPAADPFIPRDFELRPGADLPRPQRLLVEGRTERGELFFQKSTSFALPKAYLTYQFNTVRARDAGNPAVELFGRIWVDLLEERLKLHLGRGYDAYVCWQMYANTQGFKLQVWGFNEPLTRFFQALGTQIRAFIALIAEEESVGALQSGFENARVKLRKDLSEDRSHSFFYALTSCEVAMQTGKHSVNALLGEIDELSFTDYLAFHERIATRFSFQAMISGNLLPEEALRLHGDFFDALGTAHTQPLEGLDALQSRVPALQTGRTFVLQSDVAQSPHVKNCALLLFQGEQDKSQRTLLFLAENFINGQLFAELRKGSYVSWDVLAVVKVMRGVLHLVVAAESVDTASHEIARCVHAQLNALRSRLRELSAEQFDEAREAVATQLTQPLRNLCEQHMCFYDEVRHRSYNFARKEEDLKLLRGLTQTTFNEFFERFFFTQKKALEMHFVSEKEAENNVKLAEEREREENGLYPLSDYRMLQSMLALYPDVQADLSAITQFK